jgi:cyanophycinase
MNKLLTRKLLLVALYAFITLSAAFSQGHIMIVGGGTENYNDWSNIPYAWAVDNSANKKVAIVSFNSESSWLPNYFISLGATAAKNFRIHTAALANSQDTYDSLMAYDVIYFKGGNQANYYLTYKNSKVQDAVTDKFNLGGVIAGTSAGLAILSGVIYTAENGTAYSDNCLKNIFHSSITLKNDFLNLMPGYIFDSHFVERGRLGRLLAFMARWKHDHDEDLVGIGVDDMTAFCIDLSDPDNAMGYAWGTAAVNIYRDGIFGHQNNTLFCQDVKATQLLHGCSINLNTFEVEGFNSQMSVEQTTEFGNRTILLSGSDPVNENQLFITHMVDSLGSKSEPILIITGTNTTLANAYKQAYINAGATNVEVEQAIPSNNTNPAFQD